MLSLKVGARPSVLAQIQVKEVLELLNKGVRQVEISKKLKISRSTIYIWKKSYYIMSNGTVAKIREFPNP